MDIINKMKKYRPYKRISKEEIDLIFKLLRREKVIQKKVKYTNLVESLNLQMRDKISYIIRKTKVYAKPFECLDNKLAIFFFKLNLKDNK